MHTMCKHEHTDICIYELIHTQVYTGRCPEEVVWDANRCEQNTHIHSAILGS